MTFKTFTDLGKILAAVVVVAAVLAGGYAAVSYVTETALFANAAGSGSCGGCLINLDGGGSFGFPDYSRDFTSYDGGGGGGGSYTPPPPAPLCTLDLTQHNITWTTQNAYQVLIVPLTNSPQVPGYTSTNGGPSTSVVHTEADAYNSTAVKADLLSYGINLPAVQGNTGFAGDQVTMNRVCELIDGAGATASTYGSEGYSSPSNNAIVKWNGSSWSHISATAFNNHLRYSFTCVKSGTIQTYPLNGSHTFVPPLGYGTHTYKLTATGTGGVVSCEDTITIPPPEAPTCELNASPYSITQGDSSVLSWVTTNATSISIDQGVGAVTPVASGSKSVTPSSTTTYTATVTGAGGTVTCAKKVTVVPPPPSGECTLEITKVANKSTVAPNEYIEYTINFKNVGSKKCTGSGVKVTDTLDPLVTYQSETHSSNVTAGYQSDPVYKSSDRTVRFNAWDLDPNEAGWVKIKAKAGTPSTCSAVVPNYAQITSYEYNNFNSWVSSQPSANVTIEKDCTPPPSGECKLEISKSANKATAAPYDYVEYTINFKNIGQKNCTGGGVKVWDVLDAGLTYQSETHSSNVTGGYQSDPVYKSSDRTLRWNADVLTPNESGWVKFKAKVNTPSSCSVTVPNKAKITAYEYNNFNDYEVSNVVDLLVEKDCTPPPSAPTCTLTASPYQIYQGGTSVLSWTTTNATSFTIDQSVGSVTPVSGGSESVSPTANTLYTGTATGAGGTVTCTAKVKVVPPPGECKLEIVKSANKTTLSPNEVVEYTIEFKNVGGKKCTGSGVKVVDTLDTMLTYQSETHSSNVTAGYQSDPVYKSSDRTVRFNAWDLDPSEEGWVKIKAKVGTPTACTVTIPNKAKISAYEYNNFNTWVESNIVNVSVEKDCSVPVPYCTMSINPTSIQTGASATLSWDSTNVTSVSIDQGIGSVALDGTRSVSPTANTTYTGTFTGPGGTIICSASITITTPDPVPMCTLSVSHSTIKTGESVVVSWTSSNVNQGSITSIGSVTPVSGGSQEVFPADNTTFVGTFSGPYGTVTCQAPVTVTKGGGGCQGSCGGGLNPPNVVLFQKPIEAPLAFVSLEQIPYTGFEAGATLTFVFWAAVALLAALATYVVMGKGSIALIAGSLMSRAGSQYAMYQSQRPMPASDTERVDSAAYSANGTHPEPQVAYTSAKPAEDGIPDLADVIESRANGAGVLMSPEAVQLALNLSPDRAETLRMFGSMLNEAVKVIPREDGWILLTSDRFEELRSFAGTAALQPIKPTVQSVADILKGSTIPPTVVSRSQNVEMPMSVPEDQDAVIQLLEAILDGNRDRAYRVAHMLEDSHANVSTVMTVAATALDQLYRARRHGTETPLTIHATTIAEGTIQKLVEVFTHGMDHGYTNQYTGLKLAIAQAFEARG